MLLVTVWPEGARFFSLPRIAFICKDEVSLRPRKLALTNPFLRGGAALISRDFPVHSDVPVAAAGPLQFAPLKQLQPSVTAKNRRGYTDT